MKLMNKQPLHRRGLEWLTSHALWELARYLVVVVSAGLISLGITRIFHAALETGINIFLVLIGVIGIMRVFGGMRWPAPEGKTEQPKWEIFIFSPGLAVSLTPSVGRAIINLHILSTKGTELIFLHAAVRNNKGTNLDCESSEPITIDAMQITPKLIDKKFSAQELATFERGEMINLEGYAKFRDGNSIKRFGFTIPTIPSV
jgi:hypothetical protein